jgi:hypothetical protein
MLTSPRPAHRQYPIFLILLTLTLLAIFFVSIYHLTRESMAYDEGWSLWAVRLAETNEMLARVAASQRNRRRVHECRRDSIPGRVQWSVAELYAVLEQVLAFTSRRPRRLWIVAKCRLIPE